MLLHRKQATLLRCFAAILLSLSLLSGPLALPKDSVQAATKVVLSEWKFANVSESATKSTVNGVVQYKATGGALYTSSVLKGIGTSGSYTYEMAEGSVRTAGWDNGSGSKYWLASLSTTGYENIVLSSKQFSSSTGPKNFKAQISTDMQSWTDVSSSNLVLESTFSCAGSSCMLNGLALPSLASNQTQLYIRWLMDSNTSVSGSSVGSSGSSRIKDIVVEGEALSSQSSEKVAEWIFAGTGSNGLFWATDGSYKAASALRGIGNNHATYTYTSGENSIRSEGWSSGANHKYWMIALSTKHYENLTLSSQQTSSSSGPRDFKVQYSTDRLSWNDIPNGQVTLSNSSFTCSGNACKLTNLPLPNGASNQDLLYIRWVMSSNTSVSGGEINNSSSSRMKDIVVRGVRSSGAIIVNPTVPVLEAPAMGEQEVVSNAPVTVTFNKSISLVGGYKATIQDQSGASVSGVTAQIVNGNTLKLNHASFSHGKTYTVTIPKQMVKGADNVSPAGSIIWNFMTTPVTPTLLNMTFNGDPRTSMAFSWYTPEAVTGTVLQVVPASLVTGSTFPEASATTFIGTATIIDTLMTSADRSSNRTQKFASHKVIATHLTPDTEYKYRAGNGDANNWGPIGSFKTDSANNQNFNFIYTTDTQGSSKTNFELWQDTLSRAITHIGNPKFTIITGDLIDDGDLEQQWQWFLGTPANELANLPIAPVVGNHEVEDYPNNNFYNHFNLPQDVGTGALDGSVYSFEYGDALFMTINTQYKGRVSPYKIDSQLQAQMDWLRYTAAKSDKKWKVVAMHKGPYSTGANTVAEFDRVQFYRQYLIPVFDEIGVDLVLEGHDHLYMRSKQMYNDAPVTNVSYDSQGNAVNPKGSVYLMGNTGAGKFYNIDPQVNDYFSQVNSQPNKKMFIDVAVTDSILTFTSYTAAKGEAISQYDKYSIKRTDTKPNKVTNASASVSGTNATLVWNAPSGGAESARGYRIYEADNKIGTNWSAYIAAVNGQSAYSYTVGGVNSSTSYKFIIKAVGVRNNSEATEVVPGNQSSTDIAAVWNWSGVSESSTRKTVGGVIVYEATGGIYKSQSNIQGIGTSSSYTYDNTEGSLRTSGWDNGSNSKYWLAKISTENKSNLTLSSEQMSSSTGPRNFKVQISTDTSTWTDVAGTDLTLSSSFSCSGNACKLTDIPLPALANNQSTLYIRWVPTSNTSVSGSAIGSSGSSRIRNIVVKAGNSAVNPALSQ